MAADQGEGRAMATSDLSWNTGPLVIANLNYNTDNTLKSKISDLIAFVCISCFRVFWEKLPNTFVFFQVRFTMGKKRKGKIEYSNKYN